MIRTPTNAARPPATSPAATVAYALGCLLCLLAGAMLVPALFDLIEGHDDWLGFVASSGLTLFAGVALLLVSKDARESLPLKGAFVLTTASWCVTSLCGALPLMFGHFELSFTDALFESVSGLTTTGSTVIAGLDDAPPGILLWRSLLQWLGGIGIIVMALVILPFLRVGGMQLFRTESSDRSDKLLPHLAEIVRQIVGVYLGLTFLCASVYTVLGMKPFDAINHAMTTIATGGYSTYDASFGHFESPALQWAGTAFMAAAALPFMRYVAVLNHRSNLFWLDEQVRLFFAIALGVTLLLSGWLMFGLEWSFGEAVRLAAFNVVSVITTTGFATGDYSLWGAPVVTLFLTITVVGGCTGSTAGGIKMFRIQILWNWAAAYVRGLIMPHAVTRTRHNGAVVGPDVTVAVLSFAFVFIGSWGLFTALLGACGLDLVTAVSGAATALANVGPGLGSTIGPAGNFASLPDTAKWLLTAAMLLGRLEFFTLLVLLHPAFWRA